MLKKRDFIKKSMKTMKAYPVFIKQDGDDYLVYVPDWDIYTEGESFPDAIAMARDAIGAKGAMYIDDKEAFPEMSGSQEALKKAKADADETFDYSDGVLTFVDVDIQGYRNRLRNRAVKKNCTIPYWLNEEAEEEGLNFSKVLQEALMQRLNIG